MKSTVLSKEYQEGMVSVVMPCFDGERYIAEAVESVISQTYTDWELIIVDDGSSDGSGKAIEPFLRDKRIIYIKHARNRGIPLARNTGVVCSRGEYIALLDQDDIWLPAKLDKQVRAIKRAQGEKTGIVFTDQFLLQGGRLSVCSWPTSVIPVDMNNLSLEEVLESLYLANFIPTITAMLSRDCLYDTGLFDESITGGADDHDLFLRIAAKHKIIYLEERMAVKRIHPGNYYDIERVMEGELHIADKMMEMYPELVALKKKKLCAIYNRLANHYRAKHDYFTAKRYIAEAIRIRPLYLYWLKYAGCLLGIYAGEEIEERYNKYLYKLAGLQGKIIRLSKMPAVVFKKAPMRRS